MQSKARTLAEGPRSERHRGIRKAASAASAGGQADVQQAIEQAITAMVARHAVAVPPYPGVALKLGKLVRSESYGLSEVVRLVGADPSLSADLLRCANSSIYSHGGEVRSLQQAVSRIGAQEVVRLAVASALAKTAQGGALRPLKRFVWQCSVASAVVCQELAVLRRLPPEDAFLCGLLHDYGKLIALAALDEIVTAMPEIAAQPLAWWVSLVERLHVRLGLLMAGRWGLPKLFLDVLELHHDHDRSRGGPHDALVQLVATSDEIVGLMLAGPRTDMDDLKAVPQLSDVERARLAEIIPGIPSVIASFEGEAAEPALPSIVAVEDTTLPAGFRRVELLVVQIKPRQRGPYTVSGISLDGWVMTGKEAIGLNSLIQVTMECEPHPLTLWAQATGCVSEGGGMRIECKPFAATWPVSQKLCEMFRSAPA
jgi:HD-like signal output (HDOD) protein